MKERPIIFNAEMVRAVLEGRKTQSRRICKIIPDFDIDNAHAWEQDEFMLKCPHGHPGDRLWVKETWCKALGSGLCSPLERYINDDGNLWGAGAIYKATPHPDYSQVNNIKWIPSIHMPRWASRITLEIVGIRVERLNDISPEDAEEEGIGPKCECKGRFGFFEGGGYVRDCGCQDSKDGPFIEEFKNLWQSIYGSKSWNKNPWVWVIEFRRIE